MGDQDALNIALLISRVWIAIMIFAHGYRHVKAVKAGPGMANWFESLGLKPGWLHAYAVTGTEVAIPFLLIHAFLQARATEIVDSLEAAKISFLNLTQRLAPPVQLSPTGRP